jgi:hypothetical protein
MKSSAPASRPDSEAETAAAPEPLAAARHGCAADIAWLPGSARGLRGPVPVRAHLSAELTGLRDRLARELASNAARPPGGRA